MMKLLHPYSKDSWTQKTLTKMWGLCPPFVLVVSLEKKGTVFIQSLLGCPAGRDRNDRDRKLGYFTYFEDWLPTFKKGVM